MAVNAKAPSVDIKIDDGVAALNMLPHKARTQKDFIIYDKTKSMKHSPDWTKAKDYAKCLSKLLDASDGNRINQVSLLECAKKWNDEGSLGLSYENLEKGCYKLRTIINQVGNHKTKTRVVPKSHEREFQVIFDKIKTGADVEKGRTTTRTMQARPSLRSP